MIAGRRRGLKSWLVEPFQQVKLGLMFLIINIIFSILIITVFGYYVWDIYKAVSSYFQLTQEQSGLAFTKFSVPLMVGFGLILLFVVTTLLVSIRYTHEIYGPLVSIHRYLDDILEGKHQTNLQLRESDQLKDLAIKLNQVGERLLGDQRKSAMIPVHKFLDELISGQAPVPLQLRESDQLVELAKKLNRVASMVKKS